jgi:hypothetical protein
MDTIQDLLNQAVNLGLNAKLVLAVIVTGYLIKSIPIVPNWLIPFVTLAVAVSGSVLLGEMGEISHTCRYPNVQLGVNGMIPWGLGWLLHAQGLKRLEKFLPEPIKSLIGGSEPEPKP